MSKVIFPLFLPSQVQYLATGDSMVNLAFSYRLGQATVMNSVHMVCAAIEKVMLERFLPRPTQDTWKEVAQGFWNFPNCLGAIDGKHIRIQAPPLSGSQFFNYKKTFSIVLLALVDADYRFWIIQVGDLGRTSDGGVYARSDLGRGMETSTLHVPPSTSHCPTEWCTIHHGRWRSFPTQAILDETIPRS